MGEASVETVEEVGMRKGLPGVATGEAMPQRPGARVESRHTGARAASRQGSGRGASRRRGAMAPQRTCVVCRSTAAKRVLHRIVRSPDGTVAYDPSGKAAGRGAYLCGRPVCLDQAIRRRSIMRALKVSDPSAANAAVEELRTELWSGSAGQPAPRSSDDEEVRTG
jgi:uncharacterized protein